MDISQIFGHQTTWMLGRVVIFFLKDKSLVITPTTRTVKADKNRMWFSYSLTFRKETAIKMLGTVKNPEKEYDIERKRKESKKENSKK